MCGYQGALAVGSAAVLRQDICQGLNIDMGHKGKTKRPRFYWHVYVYCVCKATVASGRTCVVSCRHILETKDDFTLFSFP